jgi:hypothetical protein
VKLPWDPAPGDLPLWVAGQDVEGGEDLLRFVLSRLEDLSGENPHQGSGFPPRTPL